MGEGTKYLLGFMLGLSLGLNGGNLINSCSGRKLPNQDEMPKGSLIPDELRVEGVDDYDMDGDEEFIMKYKDKPYLMVENSEGLPSFVPYLKYGNADVEDPRVDQLEKKVKELEAKLEDKKPEQEFVFGEDSYE